MVVPLLESANRYNMVTVLTICFRHDLWIIVAASTDDRGAVIFLGSVGSSVGSDASGALFNVDDFPTYAAQ